MGSLFSPPAATMPPAAAMTAKGSTGPAVLTSMPNAPAATPAKSSVAGFAGTLKSSSQGTLGETSGGLLGG